MIGIPLSIVAGFLFDLIGRRIVIVSTFLIGAVSTICIPLVAPSVIGYDLAKVTFFETMVVLLINPFINDYVTVQSRGIATGFQQVGLTAGNLISVGGVYTMTQAIEDSMGSPYVAYSILAGMQVVWALVCGWMIKEPDVRDEKESKHF